MQMRAFWVHRRALVLAPALVLAACTSASHQAKTAAPAVRAEVAFACLWWSEAQMESLNPNAPPPKNTEVKLTKWEYSDPVGVPHPDTVDVVVSLESAGQDVSSLEAEVTGEWKNGPLRNAARRQPGAARGLWPAGHGQGTCPRIVRASGSSHWGITY